MYSKKKIDPDKVFSFLNAALLIIFSFLFLYPIIFSISCSISNPASVMNNEVVFLPIGIDFTAYAKILVANDILIGYRNTVLYTVVGTVFSVLITIMAAYPLSRRDFYGRRFFSVMFIITMYFSGGLIPTFLLVKDLGIYDTFWAFILPGMVSVINIFIMRTSFESSIPEQVFEAAHIDGCSKIGILIKIVIPLSGPVIAVITLFYAVGYWNSYFNALIYLQDEKLFPLALVLRDILTKNSVSTLIGMLPPGSRSDAALYGVNMKYAAIVVATLPILCIYPFAQKFFVKGVMIGAVKG